MNPIKVDGLLVKKTSKSGGEYYCIEFYLTDSYKAVYFLQQSEVEIIKLITKNNENK